MTPTHVISLASLLDAQTIVDLDDSMTEEWHRLPALNVPIEAPDDFVAAARAQHQANFELWHLEDEARSPYAIDHEIAQTKRAIDSAAMTLWNVATRCSSALSSRTTCRLRKRPFTRKPPA